MQLSEKRVGNVMVIEITGRLDIEAEPELLTSSESWIESKVDMVFDCTHLEFVDSSGLGILLRILKRAMSGDKDIRLAAINEQVAMLFEITRADKIFQIFPTTEEAVNSYSDQ